MLELFVYDQDLTLLGLLESIEACVWTSRLYAPGEVRVLAPFSQQYLEFLRPGRLIMRRGLADMSAKAMLDDMSAKAMLDECAMTETVEITKNHTGLEVIEARGRMLSAWCGQRIIVDGSEVSAPPIRIIELLAHENMIAPVDALRSFPRLHLTAYAGAAGDSIEYISEPWQNLQRALTDIAAAHGVGYKIVACVRTKRFIFVAYKGRSLDASSTAPVIFAPEFDNVLEQSYTDDITRVKTSAYVTGGGIDPADRPLAIYGEGWAGRQRREVHVSAGDITATTLGGYGDLEGALRERGRARLEYHRRRTGIEACVNPHISHVYRQDYDLGDMVIVRNARWGVSANMLITQVCETFEGGACDTTITFGDPPLDLAQILQER